MVNDLNIRSHARKKERCIGLDRSVAKIRRELAVCVL